MIDKHTNNLIRHLNEVNNMIDTIPKINQDEAIQRIKNINRKLNYVLEVIQKIEVNKKPEIQTNISLIKQKFSTLQDSNLFFQNNSTVAKTHNLITSALSLLNKANSSELHPHFHSAVLSSEINKEYDEKYKNQSEASADQFSISSQTQPEHINSKNNSNYETDKVNRIKSLIKHNRVKLLTVLNNESPTIKKLQNKLNKTRHNRELKDLGTLLFAPAPLIGIFMPPVGIAMFSLAMLTFGYILYSNYKLNKFLKSPEMKQLQLFHPNMLNSYESFLDNRITKSTFAKLILESPAGLDAFLEKYPPNNINSLDEFYEFILDKSTEEDSKQALLLGQTNLDPNSLNIIMDYTLESESENKNNS